MKKFVSLFLILALALCLMGCGGKAPELLGVYEIEVDMRAMMVEAFDEGTGVADSISLDRYLDRCSFTIVTEFKEDGSYSQRVDEASLQGCLDDFEAAAMAFLNDFIVLAFREQFAAVGVTVETVEDIEAQLGMSMEEAFTQSLGMPMEEMLSQMVDEALNVEELVETTRVSGKYKAQDGKLHLSDSPETSYSEDAYEIYTIDGDTVTVTGGNNVEEQPFLPYPFQMVKVA